MAFLRLGLTSFGGPVAHLGYFRAEFVQRRRWLDERAYADLVGLCQFLPGPASSQVGFGIGLLRGGWLGGLAAWTGITLPSAVLMILFAKFAGTLSTWPWGAGLLHGLKLVAVAIVAQAVWGMARSLCPDRERASIANLALVLVLFAPTSVGWICAIAGGAVVGLWVCRASIDASDSRGPEVLATPVSRIAGTCRLVLFLALLFLLPLMHELGMGVVVFDAFYRSGSLVFEGGHVVLPLLRDAVVSPGWVSDTVFLVGYGAAQAMPGPLFTFAAYLGEVLPGSWGGLLGATLALSALFLPGGLQLVGALPFWDSLRARPRMQAAMRGVNAAVVGLLGAALYDPVWTSAIHRPADYALALSGFVLLVIWQVPPLAVVMLGALGGLAIG
ncbi:MAG: chromate efflux transporter [Janthinobacterium lividum]